MDLEDELKRLFQDDRMDVQVAADADKSVVAGARRVRRRRVALVSAAGAVCAVALAAGTFVIIGPSTPSSTVDEAGQSSLPITSVESPASTAPPTEGPGPGNPPIATTSKPATPSESRSTTSSKPGPSSTSTPRPATTTLGPTGYGRLTLGMSEADLIATGLVQLDVKDGACTQYRINSGGSVQLSQAHGLVDINPAAPSTPERITIGATTDQVKDIYPDLTATGGVSQAKVQGNAKAVYRFTFTDGEVSGIRLRSNNYDCG